MKNFAMRIPVRLHVDVEMIVKEVDGTAAFEVAESIIESILRSPELDRIVTHDPAVVVCDHNGTLFIESDEIVDPEPEETS